MRALCFCAVNRRQAAFSDAIFTERIANPLATAGELASSLGIAAGTVYNHESKPEYRARLARHQREKERRAAAPRANERDLAGIVRERSLLAASAAPAEALQTIGASYACAIGRLETQAQLENPTTDDNPVAWLSPTFSRRLTRDWTEGLSLLTPGLIEEYVTEAEPLVPSSPGVYRLTFRPHSKQAEIAARWLAREARHMTFAAGRRGGKTDVVLSLKDLDCTNKSDTRVLVTGPTHVQLKNIYFTGGKVSELWGSRPDVEVLTDTMLVKFANGSYIKFAGLDNPGSQEGAAYDEIVIDEAGLIRDLLNKIDKSLMPMLFDRHGRMTVIGAPKGHGSDFHELTLRTEGWFHVSAGSFHNPHAVPIEELEAYRLQVDSKTFRQEALGQWVAHTGQVFDFDRDKHVDPTVKYDPYKPLALSFDFNRTPSSCLAMQEQGRYLVALKALSMVGDWTRPACERLLMEPLIRDHKGEIHLYGDASGSAEDSTSGTSDWAIVVEILGKHFAGQRIRREYQLSNGPVIDSDNAVNTALNPGDGTTRIRIHPDCTVLINDLTKLILPADGSRKHAKARAEAKGFGHMADCLRYYVGQVAPVPTGIWERKR